MKRAPIKYLVYRELFMVRKNLLINMGMFLGMALLCVLVQLSMKIGNLSLLSPENMELLLDVSPQSLIIIRFCLRE